MIKLEDISAGCLLSGVDPRGPVSVVAVNWYGENALEIFYKTEGGLPENRLLYRGDEVDLSIAEQKIPWSFDGDGDLMRLVSEAYRIRLAHLFDPYLAIHTSSVEPLPHQISAVYEEMLPRLPLRYVLADDPGAGKTIMTGLLLTELMARGDLKRCLIVAPGSLTEQWQDELFQKFNLCFEILTSDRIRASATRNIFQETAYSIASLDMLARNEGFQEKLKAADWDLIVVDEAHKMAATVWGREAKYTKRFLLGRLLSGLAGHFLLLTATPHNGKPHDFELFMSLIDPDRFEGAPRSDKASPDVSDVMRRLVKEDLLTFEGKPLFPERIARTVNYDMSAEEAKLYEDVTEYVREEFNRADKLKGDRKNTVGFALTILQRRLASSPEAIYQSLHRRRIRLEERLAEERLGRPKMAFAVSGLSDDEYDDDDLLSSEFEELEQIVSDQASAASTISEMNAEIQTLSRLENMAAKLRASGKDRKWEALSQLLQVEEMFSAEGRREKLIIFTEHRDTLQYLTDRIGTLFGDDSVVATIHGGLSREARRAVEERFRQDDDLRILVATDAAGEGINLQRAHLMINYDLPWNPNRLEQRFGRIHRIGQKEVCTLWNLVSNKTREGQVFERLFEKLNTEREALSGKVFDVLGKIEFDNRSLKDLLVEAVRYGDDPKVRSHLDRVVDRSLDRDKLRAILNEQALTEDSMDVSKVMAIREEMERAEARRLQPHFIEAFFLEGFRRLGGRVRPAEKGRYRITWVPGDLIRRSMGTGAPVLSKYERVCFDKRDCHIPGKPQADLLCPGHPLLDAVVDLLWERNSDVLRRGSVFIDESDFGKNPRLLFYIEASIEDGVVQPNGQKHVVSKTVQFVELRPDGTSRNAGYAPYLDYRGAHEEEQAAALEYIRRQDWLSGDVKNDALKIAATEILPTQLAEVRERRLDRIKKTEKAVKERLRAEIQYWDFRAVKLREEEEAGKRSEGINSQNATRRADELNVRMKNRLAELEKEKRISPSPPIITGAALVIPKGLLHTLTNTPLPEKSAAPDLQAIEFAAMNAVMEIERSLGYEPVDVSAKKCGYDVESVVTGRRTVGGPILRMIEVKGRRKGESEVTLTKNEILTALNAKNNFILAIVEVDGNTTTATYLKNLAISVPDFGETRRTFTISALKDKSEIVYGG